MAPSAFHAAANLTQRTYSKSRSGWSGVPSPRTHLRSPAPRSLSPAARGVQRPARLAPERWPSGFCGLGLGGARPADPDGSAQGAPPLHFAAPGRSGTSGGGRHGCPPSGSRGPGGGVLGRRPGPAARGACVALPSPPAGLGRASPTAGFVHRPRGGPSPFPPAPPRPHPAGPTSSARAAGAGRRRRG